MEKLGRDIVKLLFSGCASMREMKGRKALTGMPQTDGCRQAQARMCELRVVYPMKRRNAS
tara:strand:+ start:286 stop:465 length:180 start_codon:yes stop_codon:yes gene_type:complete